jgi:hypothetical protein
MAFAAHGQPFPRHLPKNGAEPGVGGRLQHRGNSACYRRPGAVGVVLSPTIGAVLTSLSTIIVAVNVQLQCGARL